MFWDLWSKVCHQIKEVCDSLRLICSSLKSIDNKLFASCVFFMLLLASERSADFFPKNSFRNTIRVSNGLDPDQDLCKDVKIVIFWMIFGNFKAFNKCPLQKNGEKTIMPFAINFRICCLISKHTVHFYPGFQ